MVLVFFIKGIIIFGTGYELDVMLVDKQQFSFLIYLNTESSGKHNLVCILLSYSLHSTPFYLRFCLLCTQQFLNVCTRMQNIVCYEEKRDSKAECEWKEKGVLNANTVRIQSSPVYNTPLHNFAGSSSARSRSLVWFY